MNIIRDKELVNQYHFDVRNSEWEENNGVPTTKLKVDFQLIDRNEEEQKMSIIVILRFMIVLDHFVISGAMSQGIHMTDRVVQDVDEFTEGEKRFLVDPLLDMLKRLTYEVTEIALDAPGVNLEF
ncbi:DUF1149 family protein [Streptococcus sp. zg-86]|uniref:DUF1149 family protein n=1 Tax=Streptococcus zhangguiae TaxID=2664091 RepID=A0A6I4RU52_9STRE|nr:MULTISPECIES: DUF1149 family protein [unclassified Streptococcus]MTB64634.1 DUF1149 family protein [Streptococcus sp. zg-86]MTB90944.1 DUF1149 family protein [Streptococcus sp. zg-36]MWV56632.1 DUF1149 family protein [Streptococcus sp. zg-70]QTH48591.1 DUF1149 family protein [Streptococcus sp. zg-86]